MSGLILIISDVRRFKFSTEKGDDIAEIMIKSLLEHSNLQISEFQISRPDLETIFLRATKKNWDQEDIFKRKKNQL